VVKTGGCPGREARTTDLGVDDGNIICQVTLGQSDLGPEATQAVRGSARVKGHRARRGADHEMGTHVVLGKRVQHPHLHGTEAAPAAQDEADRS
jgi:hypothetical protein